jgi:hypothetical protein
MEVTKWLKPSISVSRIGDSASVQAATRVNAERASNAFSSGSVKKLSRDRDCNLSDRSSEHFGDELGSLILDRRVRPRTCSRR